MIAMNYYNDKLKLIKKWAWKDTETSNFYYTLMGSNQKHLASLVALVTNEKLAKIFSYFEELENDIELRQHI